MSAPEDKTLRLSELINPTEQQRKFLDAALKRKFVLYGGAAGGGKSYILRWFALLFTLRAFAVYKIRNVNFGLFCEDYPTLTDRQISRIAIEFPAELGVLKETRAEGYAFRLHEGLGGGKILLRNLDDPSKYNSTEFAGMGVDELTFNQESVFEELRKRIRWVGFPADFNFPFVAATNPGGIGHAWVKRLWKDRDFYPELKPYADEFVFIPARAIDNPHLPESYYAALQSLKDPQMRRAMAEGDWDLFAGQFFSEWRAERHVCDPFPIPAHWQRWTASDWGYAKPACCLWFARSPEGKTYVYREWYGADVRTIELGRTWKDLNAGDPLRYRALDPACWDTSRGKSVADELSEVGWNCVKADNKRVGGWSRVRSGLAWRDALTSREFVPELQVFRTCKDLIRTLPTLIYDKHKSEDLDSDGEDHAADSLRYGLVPPILETEEPYDKMSLDDEEAFRRAQKWPN